VTLVDGATERPHQAESRDEGDEREDPPPPQPQVSRLELPHSIRV
jgi:hypothetical protein